MCTRSGRITASLVAILGLFLVVGNGTAEDYRLTDTPNGAYAPSQDTAVMNDADLGYIGDGGYIEHPPGHSGGCGMGSCCGACPTCQGVPCGGMIWVQSDSLLWWTKGNRLPALVTTSPQGTDRDEAGVLGEDGTTILFGDERVDANLRLGLRYRVGAWLDSCYSIGVEGHYLYLNDGNNTGDYSQSSLGDPILARPFFNTELDAQDSQLVAFPGVVEGRIDIRTSSEMHSAGLLLRHAWSRGPQGQVDLLAGYRFLQYREGLRITEDLVVLDVPGFPEGTLVDLRDAFGTKNDFHGGEIGVNSTFFYHGLAVDFVGKVALGNVHQQVRVDGETLRTLPNGDESVSEGGLLALPTNIGERSRNKFAFLPEMNLNVRYPLTHSLDLTVGYTLMYLTNVVRTGDQIDTVINPSQLIQNGGALQGPERPAPLFHDTAIWAQGLNVGVNWVY